MTEQISDDNFRPNEPDHLKRLSRRRFIALTICSLAGINLLAGWYLITRRKRPELIVHAKVPSRSSGIGTTEWTDGAQKRSRHLSLNYVRVSNLGKRMGVSIAFTFRDRSDTGSQVQIEVQLRDSQGHLIADRKVTSEAMTPKRETAFSSRGIVATDSGEIQENVTLVLPEHTWPAEVVVLFTSA